MIFSMSNEVQLMIGCIFSWDSSSVLCDNVSVGLLVKNEY